jgi:hypothetical protein
MIVWRRIILYVGCTAMFSKRKSQQRQHPIFKALWDEIEMLSLVSFASRNDALLMETLLTGKLKLQGQCELNTRRSHVRGKR